jgi:hypothetical protein
VGREGVQHDRYDLLPGYLIDSKLAICKFQIANLQTCKLANLQTC